MPVERNGPAVTNRIRPEAANRAAKHAAANDLGLWRARLPVHGVLPEMHFDGRPREQTAARLDEHAAGRDVDDRRVVSRTNPRRDNPVIVRPCVTRVPPALRRAGHDGFHCRDTASNFSTRVLPGSPVIRTAYWAFLRPRTYSVPDEAVPNGVNVRMLLEPSLIGSAPGGVPPGSTGGNPARVPKSTPENKSGSRSRLPIGGSTPR